jgi:Na+/melibiose symporter-like transporter
MSECSEITSGQAPAAPPATAATDIPTNLAAAAVGAVIWAVITVTTKFQIGSMAVGVGFLVGWALQRTGRSGAAVLGVVGATFALGGAVLGNLLSASGFVAAGRNLPLFDVVGRVFTQPSVASSLLQATFNPMDLLFYAIAVYEGYKLARTPRAS